MIADVVINLGGKIVKEKSVLNILVMIASFVCVAFLKVNIILVILVCGIIGLISTLIKGKKGGEK